MAEVVVDPEAMALTDAQQWQMTAFISDIFLEVVFCPSMRSSDGGFRRPLLDNCRNLMKFPSSAGNRSNAGYAYDHLNMMTASPGSTTYENDILGNRLWRNPASATTTRYSVGRCGADDAGCQQLWWCQLHVPCRWDADQESNRPAAHFEDEEAGSGYDEEQDANNPTYRYRYDGQMCFEDDYTVAIPGSPPSASVTGNSYALGARGIDMIRTFSVNVSNFNRSFTGTQFPICDGHGNMIATLSRNGTGNTIENNRSYDVWGSMRSSSSLNPSAMNGPNNRYCANLGHKQDDESDLIYMRARYYEPGTGRFISEDPAMDGWNWFTYARSNPIGNYDPSGKYSVGDAVNVLGLLGCLTALIGAWIASTLARPMIISGVGMLATWFLLEACGELSAEKGDKAALGALFLFVGLSAAVLFGQGAPWGSAKGAPTILTEVLSVVGAYAAILTSFIVLNDWFG